MNLCGLLGTFFVHFSDPGSFQLALDRVTHRIMQSGSLSRIGSHFLEQLDKKPPRQRQSLLATGKRGGAETGELLGMLWDPKQ